MDGDKKPPCHVCEGTDYYLQSGFYYCNECHTQALGCCENVVDFQDNTTNLLSVTFKDKTIERQIREKNPHPTASEFQWTSWEGYNYLLKGWVDELISLGARPELKAVALQLWAKYLNKLEVAFISKTEQLLPKFGLSQSAADYKIIYGQVKERTIRLKLLMDKKHSSKLRMEKKISKADDMTEKQMFFLAKKLCVITEYETIMAELAASQDILSQIDEGLKQMAEAQEATKKKGAATASNVENSAQYNRKAKAILKELTERKRKRKRFRKEVNDDEEGDEELEPSTLEEYNQDMKDKWSLTNNRLEIHDAMFLTRQKMLALLTLALFMSKDDIQISDLIRWITEGHVSFYNVTHLFPEDSMLGNSEIQFIKEHPTVRYKNLENCVASLVGLLELDAIPTPNFMRLACRYLRELELPSALATHVGSLISVCHIDTYVGLLSHEAITIASLFVVLKALLGLDGTTEHRISTVARKINRLIDHDPKRQLETKLFVWDDWVHYIVCRKSIIMNTHFHTRHKFERDLSTSSNSYADWWYKNYDKDPILKDRRISQTYRYRSKLHQPAADKLETSTNTLPDILEDNFDKLPPTLTPHTSYLQEIRAQWCLDDNKCSVQPSDILTYMHSLTSVDFLVQPNRIIDFAHSKGVNVVVQKSRASQESELVLKMEKGAIRMSHAARKQVMVGIEPPWIDNVPHGDKRKRSRILEKIANATANESDEGYSQVSKKRKLKHSANSSDATCNYKDHISQNNSTSSLLLYAPITDYWIYELHPRQSECYFEEYVEPDLPDSFCWLLTECSRLLEMRTVDLYSQVRLVEDLCFKNVGLATLKQSIKLDNTSNKYQEYD